MPSTENQSLLDPNNNNSVAVGGEGDQMILGGNDELPPIQSEEEDDSEDAQPMQGVQAPSVRDDSEEDYEDDKEQKKEVRNGDPYKGVDFGGFTDALKVERHDEVKKKNVAEEKPAPQKQVEQPAEVQKTRDFAGLEEEEIPDWKRMSYKTFSKIKPGWIEYKNLKRTVIPEYEKKIKELQSGKQQVPEAYYEHPEAYTLLPEYKESATKINQINTARQFFQEQLDKASAGEDYQDLIVDDKGNFRPTDPIPASPKAVQQIQQFLSTSYINLTQENARLANLQQSFKNRHQEELKSIQETEARYFPGYEKEDHPTRGIQKQVLEMLPAMFRSHPLAGVISKTAAANAVLKQKYSDLEQKYNALVGTKADAKAAGPKPKEATGGVTKKGPLGGVTMEDFNKLREL